MRTIAARLFGDVEGLVRPADQSLFILPDTYLGDIGFVIQQHAEKAGYSVVREFCGHGIGKVFHEEPQVLHYGRPGTLDKLVPGMIFTVEPMINAGRREIREILALLM